MEIGLLAAVLGGALALLSPCGALLLPTFFASISGKGGRLAAHITVFYLGLLSVLVPLGMGASAIGGLFTQHRTLLIYGAGSLIIGFGLMQILGRGFTLERVLPSGIDGAARNAGGLMRALLLGITSGVAGFCAGPILGAVLTVAAAQGDVLGGGILLAAYALGMVLPLVMLVLLWHNTGIRNRARGRGFSFAGREFHSTSVITGVILITVGITFIATNGLISAPSPIGMDTQVDMQNTASRVGESLPRIGVILVAAAVALALWWWWPRPDGNRQFPATGESQPE